MYVLDYRKKERKRGTFIHALGHREARGFRVILTNSGSTGHGSVEISFHLKYCSVF